MKIEKNSQDGHPIPRKTLDTSIERLKNKSKPWNKNGQKLSRV